MENKKNEKLKKEYEKLIEQYTKLQNNFDYIYNEYNRMISSNSWKITKPLRNIEKVYTEINKIIKSKKDKKESILFLLHSWINMYDKNTTNIGGTTLHVLDIINEIRDKKNCYVLTIINNMYSLVVFEKNSQKIYDLNIPVKIKNYDGYDYNFLIMFENLIKNLKIDLVHIHHIIGFPCDLSFIIKNVKTVMTIHDYSLICSNYFLIDAEGKLCEKIDKRKCHYCAKKTSINYKVRINAINKLIQNVEKFIVPDESIIKNFNNYIDIKNYILIPHGIKYSEFEKIEYSDKKLKDKFNVAFVGVISEHKGKNIIRELVENNSNENINYHLFGLTDDEFLKSNQNNYINHGIYKKAELPNLLNKNNINLVLLLSICPETFSYALSEIIYAQIPVLSFDIGAIANRIKKYNIGWILNSKSNYKEIEEKYIEIMNEQEYNNKMQNLKHCENSSIEEMVEEINKIYEEFNINNIKDYYKINSHIDKYYLKYEIK